MSVGQLGGVLLFLCFSGAGVGAGKGEGAGSVASSPTHSCLASSWEGWASSREEAEALFYRQGDWGFLEDLGEGLQEYCPGDGPRLQCSKHLAYCRARNLVMDFRGLKDRVRKENLRYSTNIFSPGSLSLPGCSLAPSLTSQLDMLSPLQSWGPELQHLQHQEEEEEEQQCDITVTGPAMVVKLDATSNMYHHFCDFLNMFLSLHLNSSLTSSPLDHQVLILDNHPYTSSFSPAWAAFTSKPLWDLNKVAGKVVCFRDLLLPLPPRMLFGLYYNTPLVPGCSNSAMIRAFSSFMVSRLGVEVESLAGPKLRVTLLSRQTSYRRILNEGEVVAALEETGLYTVQVARFTSRVPFLEQVSLVTSSDILLGVHGAGLTHLLFLPDWAQVVELYNCEDPECYKDLARLRGVGYSTWEREDKITRVPGDQSNPNARGPAHKKFANYEFDVEETLRLVAGARKKVMEHEKYLEQVQKIRDEL